MAAKMRSSFALMFALLLVTTGCAKGDPELNLQPGTTLVVVDMQSQFEAAKKESTKLAVERQIESAIANKWPIVVLEFKDCGKTDALLMKHLEGKYGRYVVEEKSWADGSQQVRKACKEHGYPTENFRVCGVNTDACVIATVEGLIVNFPECKVDVIKPACNTYNEGGGWQEYKRVVGNVVMSDDEMLSPSLQSAKAEPTLVVVDMQPKFYAAQEEATLLAVKRQIQDAIKNNRPIVLLEFTGYGKTDKSLMEELEGAKYARFAVHHKDERDGSKQVVEACKANGFDNKHFRVCGVYTDQCVLATVEGLTKRLPGCAIDVIKPACNSGGYTVNWSIYDKCLGTTLSDDELLSTQKTVDTTTESAGS